MWKRVLRRGADSSESLVRMLLLPDGPSMRLCAARDHQLAGNRYGFPPLEKYEPSARYHQEREKDRDRRKRARSKRESEEEVVASRPKRRARAKKKN